MKTFKIFLRKTTKSGGIQLEFFITYKKSFGIKKYTNFNGLFFKKKFNEFYHIF